MPSIGWQELIVVLVIVLVIFGPKRLPEMGRSVGSSIREFRNSTKEGGELQDQEVLREPPVEKVKSA